MKKLSVLYVGLLSLFFCNEYAAQAQSFSLRNNRKVIASVGTGFSTYLGDLQDPGDYLDLKPNIVIGLQQVVSERFGARAELSWFQLQGSDFEDGTADGGSRNERNLSFTSSNVEVNVEGIFTLYKHPRRYYQRATFNAYAFAGLGVVFFNPKADYIDGKKYALRPLKTEGVKYGKATLTIPMGLGVKFKVNPFLNIALEMGYRKTFTDYMDDVSTVYIDNDSFEPGSIAQKLADRRPELFGPGSQWEAGHIRGDPDDNDGYVLYNIKLEYYLPFNNVKELVYGKRSGSRRPRSSSRRIRRPKRR